MGKDTVYYIINYTAFLYGGWKKTYALAVTGEYRAAP
jgi:hypothetical protein